MLSSIICGLVYGGVELQGLVLQQPLTKHSGESWRLMSPAKNVLLGNIMSSNYVI